MNPPTLGNDDVMREEVKLSIQFNDQPDNRLVVANNAKNRKSHKNSIIPNAMIA